MAQARSDDRNCSDLVANRQPGSEALLYSILRRNDGTTAEMAYEF